MDGMKAFHTRERANEGIRLPLSLPTGEKTEHWLQLRGVDSDHFREAEEESRRAAVIAASIEDETEQRKRVQAAKEDLVASLVMDWSFEEECNEANVLAFLREAPQIMEDINRVCGSRRVFFAQWQNNSPITPRPSSDSIDQSPNHQPH